MESAQPFKEAMAASLLEYHLARADVMSSISNGTAHGEIWRQK
jgi:hypothetical protein